MLNYHKTYRESLDKAKRRPTPKKQPTINRSHTSSINLKLSSDLEQMKGSIKNLKQNNDPSRKQSMTHTKSKSNIKNENAISSSQFKYSFKIKQDSDLYEGSRIRMKTNYDQSSNIKPFRQSNRCLITQRNQKMFDYKFCQKSKQKKNDGHLRTQYKENSENNEFYGQLREKSSQKEVFLKFDDPELKMKKDFSTKHNTQSLNSIQKQMVKVPITELKKMYQQFKNYEKQISYLQKQVAFYRKNGTKNPKNSILLALNQ